MKETRLQLPHITLNFREDGDSNGAPLVFSNALGTSLELWGEVVEHLPEGLRIIRYDMRGQGASDAPEAPYKMGGLIRDIECLLDALNIRDCVFVGISIGGMIAQGLATKRLDQVRALVLCNTGLKIGTPAHWDKRIEYVRQHGLDAIADEEMRRWFSRSFDDADAVKAWRNALTESSIEGYIGACAAIAGTDFYTQTAALRLPTLVLAGSDDQTTPPDMVRDISEHIPGAQFELMRRVGHLPPIENPGGFAGHVTNFLRDIGHL